MKQDIRVHFPIVLFHLYFSIRYTYFHRKKTRKAKAFQVFLYFLGNDSIIVWRTAERDELL